MNHASKGWRESLHFPRNKVMDVSELKYQADDYAQYYAAKHESSAARSVSNWLERRMMTRALRRVSRNGLLGSVLDMPSGAGRFLPVLGGCCRSVVAMDVASAMLRQGENMWSGVGHQPKMIAASASAIPLADDSVDVVFCARLLHHLSDTASRQALFVELARVARRGVVLSFFDATCYRNWRRQRKVRRKGKERGRHCLTRSECTGLGQEAGLRLLGMNALFRYHSEVTAAAFVVA